MLYLGSDHRKGAERNGFLGKSFDLVLNRVGFISAHHSSVFRVHSVWLVSMDWLVVRSPPTRSFSKPTLLERKSHLGDRRLVHGVVRYRRRSSDCLGIILIASDELSFYESWKMSIAPTGLYTSALMLTPRDGIEC